MRSTLILGLGATGSGPFAARDARGWAAESARLKRAHGGVSGDAGRVLGAVLLLDLPVGAPAEAYGVHDHRDEEHEHDQVGDGSDRRVTDEREQQDQEDDPEEHLTDREATVDDVAREPPRRPGVAAREVPLVTSDEG